MTDTGYTDKIKEVIEKFDPQGSNRYFLFGSSVRKQKFHDLDIGVIGNAHAKKDLSRLREDFYESTIPYKVDIVDFDEADADFRDYVTQNEPVVWIQ